MKMINTFLITVIAILANIGTLHCFDLDDLADLRALIIEEIEAETSGLILGNPLVGPFDGLIPGEQPLIPALIRLAFHDCSGLNTLSTANKFNEYSCDGCIKLDHPDHKGLYEGAIDPIEDICAFFYDAGLSRADCWALAATFAIEQAANNTLTTLFLRILGLNPTTVDILPGDIPYLIGREDCDTSPETAEDVGFEPFLTTDGWDVTSEGLKRRFGLDSNQEVREEHTHQYLEMCMVGMYHLMQWIMIILLR
eukprot:542353_1